MKKLSLILLSLLMLSALISCQNESQMPALAKMTEKEEKIFAVGSNATNQLLLCYQNNIPVEGNIEDSLDYSTRTSTYTLSDCSATVDLTEYNLGKVEVSNLSGRVTYKYSNTDSIFPFTVSILSTFKMEGDIHTIYSKTEYNSIADIKLLSLKVDGVSYDVSEINKIFGNN